MSKNSERFFRYSAFNATGALWRDANDVPAARAILGKLVLGYTPSVDVVDLVSPETATDTQGLKRERLVRTTC